MKYSDVTDVVEVQYEMQKSMSVQCHDKNVHAQRSQGIQSDDSHRNFKLVPFYLAENFLTFSLAAIFRLTCSVDVAFATGIITLNCLTFW